MSNQEKLNAVFDSRENVENWIKESLEEWFESQKGSAFTPFEEHFKLRLYPYEVLASIYVSLSCKRTDCSKPSQASFFRSACAHLLKEPKIIRHSPEIYLELLRLGAEIGSKEILASLTDMLRTKSLPRVVCVLDDNRHEIHIMAETVGTILRAGFTGKPLIRFLMLATDQIEENEPNPMTIATAFARHDPRNWGRHFINLEPALTDYFDAHTDQPDFEQLKEYFRDHLQMVTGEKYYHKGIEYLTNKKRLGWLVAPR